MTSMNFNTKIATTREQSERLLALGVKPETADMSMTEPGTEPEMIAMTDWLIQNEHFNKEHLKQ
uniref:Uncharacterized protein n=1 Tax=Siphoviridae sp. ctr8v12 TaxID=2825685 RepID=A0A8S5QGT0_9CAUD|nr:MAG TPA: hypothetical protein [Siphoviridae sp. ctr8v12]